MMSGPSTAHPGGADFLRLHWFDIGVVLAALAGMYLWATRPAGLALILWIGLVALFIHQFEEYRYPGYFPGMINSVFFSSKHPDRYPLNTNSAVVVNLGTGWLAYALAALFNTKALWLGIAVTMVTLGNFLIHTFVFNLKGRTRYNPGMATGLILFLPISVCFYYLAIRSDAASPLEWVFGIALGITLFYVGIDKIVDWLKDEDTSYVFPSRCLLPSSRNSKPSKPSRGP
jgi:hypothetical protein